MLADSHDWAWHSLRDALRGAPKAARLSRLRRSAGGGAEGDQLTASLQLTVPVGKSAETPRFPVQKMRQHRQRLARYRGKTP